MSDRVRLTSVLATMLLLTSIIAGCGGDDDDGNAAPENGGGNSDSNGGVVSEGQEIYNGLDCAECHGPNAEGDGSNPRLALAGTPLIIQQVRTRIRNGKGEQMPAYSEEQISDEEIELMFEWFKSQ